MYVIYIHNLHAYVSVHNKLIRNQLALLTKGFLNTGNTYNNK